MIKWFKNLNIKVRLLIGFFLVSAIALVIGIVGIYNLNKVNESYKKAYTSSVDALQFTERISSYFQRIRTDLNAMMLADDQETKAYFIELIDNNKAVIDDNITKYKDILNDFDIEEVAIELELIDSVQASLIEYSLIRNEIIQAIGIDSNHRIESFEFLMDDGELGVLAQKVEDAINELINYNSDYAVNQITSNGNQATNATIIIVIATIISVIFALILGVLISFSIAKPISMIVKAADQLALGDMEIKEEIESKDEIGMLAKAMNRIIESTREQADIVEKLAMGDLTSEIIIRSEKDLMGESLTHLVDGLNDMINNIASASEQVAAGSKQISTSSLALSEGSTEQASSIEELTASIEEISSQTKANAENAEEANRLAEESESTAAQGNKRMKEMVKAMDDINESSNNISKIIKVIDDIAFQTNMLSLNAAVEAARAGQHGKGFAVVAEEVKTLAARSAEAAKETTELIDGSIKKTELGSKIAKDTEEALNDIVDGIEKVASLVKDISTASKEQYAGIAQINQGIMQVSEVVQNNSATSEEGAAASEELSSQADVLHELVTDFKLKKSRGTYSKKEELSPEVLKMLEQMSQRGKGESRELMVNSDKDDLEKTKIVLSDNEFGKY